MTANLLKSFLPPAARKLGPYVLMELLLPGGTLLALLLWLSACSARGGFATVYLPSVDPHAIERIIAAGDPHRTLDALRRALEQAPAVERTDG